MCLQSTQFAAIYAQSAITAILFMMHLGKELEKLNYFLRKNFLFKLTQSSNITVTAFSDNAILV